MRIFSLFFSVLFVTGCNDDRITIPSENPEYIYPSPSKGFEEILYREPIIHFYPGIRLIDDTANLPKQGDHWKNGAIEAPSNGEFEISGRISLEELGYYYQWDQRWKGKLIEINANLDNKVIKISGAVKDRKHDYWVNEDLWHHYAYFKGIKIPVKEKQLLFFSKSATQNGATHLGRLIVYFKPKEDKKGGESVEGSDDTLSTPERGDKSQE